MHNPLSLEAQLEDLAFDLAQAHYRLCHWNELQEWRRTSFDSGWLGGQRWNARWRLRERLVYARGLRKDYRRLCKAVRDGIRRGFHLEETHRRVGSYPWRKPQELGQEAEKA